MHEDRNRLQYIEISRGIASLLVVCFHASSIIGLPKYFGLMPLNGVFSFCYAGVDFFFVLSGFIIFYSTAKNHGNISSVFSYLKHRFIRIYPIYWVVGLILLPLTYLMGHHVGVNNTVMDFLLLPREKPPFVAVAWTLRHEMLFYFSFVLFFINVTIAWSYFLVWGATISVCSLLSLDTPSPFMSLYFNDHNLEFLFGILVAKFAKPNLEARNYQVFFFLVGAAVFTVSGYNDSIVNVGDYSYYGHYHLWYGGGGALIISGLIGFKADLKKFWVRTGSFLGRASYSIYLIHFAVMSAVIKILLPLALALWINMILLVLAGVLIGSLLYHYVERPLLSQIRNRVALTNKAPT